VDVPGTYSAPAISADGRYLTFVATNPTAPGISSILLADICLDSQIAASCRTSITRVSVSADGTDLAGENASPSISGDGRFVVFASTDATGASKILLRDTCLGASAEANCAAATSLLASQAAAPSISANGRFVSFAAAVAVSATAVSSARTLNVFDTCYAASTGCVAGSSSLPFSVDTGTIAPLNADGSAVVFSTSAGVAGLPLDSYLTGRGDVLLFAPNF
jgi:Tol biopolymer transport system component